VPGLVNRSAADGTAFRPSRLTLCSANDSDDRGQIAGQAIDPDTGGTVGGVATVRRADT
jgi:hypothetical protein